VILLAGCARAVSVAPPDPAPDATTAAACAAFTAALPDALESAGDRRGTSPESPLTAAYGDPPVAVRCGVPAPAALTPTSLLVSVDGVDWLPEELTEGWVLTSVGRAANVELTVPDALGPAPSIAADLAATIAATLPATSS
jgi:hypothetical protein